MSNIPYQLRLQNDLILGNISMQPKAHFSPKAHTVSNELNQQVRVLPEHSVTMSTRQGMVQTYHPHHYHHQPGEEREGPQGNNPHH